ncbi:MAG TPA: hypothetical protein VIM65_06845 [Cyclobacteriaceae bacterium]
MRFTLLCVSILIGINFSSCKKSDTKPAYTDGFENVYTDDGTLLQRIKYIHNDEDRIVRDYYKNGQLFQEIHYVNYKMQGEVKKFYEDGKPYMIVPYDSGKVDGIEIKYRKDGTLAYEAPYRKGKPITGLKEYLLDGSLKTQYPRLVIKPIDRMLTDEVYILQLSMSDGSHHVEYYEGKLTDGLYLGEDASQMYPVKKGVLNKEYYVPQGGFRMEQVSFIAKLKTSQGNYYFTKASYNLAVENR